MSPEDDPNNIPKEQLKVNAVLFDNNNKQLDTKQEKVKYLNVDITLFELPALKKGKYKATVELADANGKTIASAEKEFHVFKQYGKIAKIVKLEEDGRSPPDQIQPDVKADTKPAPKSRINLNLPRDIIKNRIGGDSLVILEYVTEQIFGRIRNNATDFP